MTMYSNRDKMVSSEQEGGESMKKAVRDQTIIVKLSADEKREIFRAAYMNGETMSNYIRRTLLRGSRKEEEK